VVQDLECIKVEEKATSITNNEKNNMEEKGKEDGEPDRVVMPDRDFAIKEQMKKLITDFESLK